MRAEYYNKKAQLLAFNPKIESLCPHDYKTTTAKVKYHKTASELGLLETT